MNRFLKPVFAYFLAGLALSGCTWGGAEVDPAQIAKDMTKLAPLQIHLETDKEKVGLGEEITFTTTVFNPNSVPVNLFLGPNYFGNKFGNGLILQARRPEVEWTKGDIFQSSYVEFACGTGSYSLYKTLRPKSDVQFLVRPVLERDAKGPFLKFIDEGVELRLPEDGKFIVRTYHTVNFNHDSELPPKKTNRNGQAYSPDMNAPFFEGTLISNDVLIEVRSQKK